MNEDRPDGWRETLAEARRHLLRSRARSALATVGLVVAIVALATLGTVGTAAEHGTPAPPVDPERQVAVTPHPESGSPALTDRDVRDLRRVADGDVVPVREGRARVGQGRQLQPATLTAVENPARYYEADEGRVPPTLQRRVVVSSSLATRFDLSVGSVLRVGNESYAVAAVLERQPGNAPLSVEGVLVPTGTLAGPGYAKAVVVAADAEAANRTAHAIETRLNGREPRFAASLGGDRAGRFATLQDRVLLAVAGGSLLLGALGVLAALLLGVVERRGEFADVVEAGGDRREVFGLVLAEALVLGVLGGLTGVTVGVFVGAVLNLSLLGDAAAVFVPRTLAFLAAGFLLAVLASVLAGLYPAYRAAADAVADPLRT